MVSVTVTKTSKSGASKSGTGKPGAGERVGHRPLRRRPVSPLTLRILAVNVLALALLVGGLLYLGRYQDRLILAEMEALETEARIFASALGEGAVQRAEAAAEAAAAAEDGGETYELSAELARQMVRRLVEATETRTRLYAADGTAVSDSRVLTGSAGTIQIVELPAPDERGAATRAAVRLYNWLTDTLPGRDDLPVYRERPPGRADLYPDVERALAGERSGTVWRTAETGEGRPGLVLTVAVPVQRYKQVMGAVMLSRSGAEIDAAIRSVRFDILRIFALALAVTVLLSFYLAGTIARPVRMLARAAERVRSGHGRHMEIPDFTGRGDEIGDLSGALRAMTGALWARMDAIERFAADVAHEIKNPLTSLRSAVETVGRVSDPGRRDRLMAIIADDVQRLDRLISDISNASRLDAELSRAEPEPVDVGAVLAMLADIHAATAEDDGEDAPRLVVELPVGQDLTVPGLEGRLTQVFQNLIANALSFSPPGGTVRLAARRDGRAVVVTVADDGPGIPEGKEQAIFDRFYTERPAGEKFGTHSGLGLSISRQIVEAHGGTITAANRPNSDGSPDGPPAGALFTVRLPRAD
ncbi:MAG TPA: stimulus-sensing domain-containing protein [Azospirillum sp.]